MPESPPPPATGPPRPAAREPRDRRVPPPPRRGVAAAVAAAAAGWLLPGLGDPVTGHVARGLILAVTLTSLWLAGLAIGGLSVVDRQNDPAWFLGQALIAPSLLADRYRGRLVAEHHAAHREVTTRHAGRLLPRFNPPFEPAFGRARELGTLYTSLAGLLNLLAMLDVVYRPRPQPRARPHPRTPPTAPSPAPAPA